MFSVERRHAFAPIVPEPSVIPACSANTPAVESLAEFVSWESPTTELPAPDAVLCPDPTAVYFGDRYFNHRDHRVTGWATLDAIAPAAGNPHYFPEQIAEGLAVHQVRDVYLSGTLEPNCWVDIGDTLERKIDGLFCHASQLADAYASAWEEWAASEDAQVWHVTAGDGLTD